MTAKKLLIETNSGASFPLDLAATPTVGELKHLLAAKERSDRSTLIVKLGPRILPDDFRLSETELLSGGMSWDYTSSLPTHHVTFRAPDGRLVKTRYSKQTTVAKAVVVICKVLKIKNPDTFAVFVNDAEISRGAALSSLDLSESSVVRIEDPPKVLKIEYKRPDGRKFVASTRYRGIATAQIVRAKTAAAFGLENSATALFLGESRIGDDALLADLGIPETGLEIRVVGDGWNDGSPRPAVGNESPVHRVGIRTPTKLVKAHFKEGATVGEAKVKIAQVLDLDAEQLLFSKKPGDKDLLKDLQPAEGELHLHVYRPIGIRFPNGPTIRGRFSELATVKSTKEAVGKRLSIPVSDIHFDIEYSDEEKRMQDLELPESGIIKVRSSKRKNEGDDDQGYAPDPDEEVPAKRKVTRKDVNYVKLEFPNGFQEKTCFRAKATVEKAREAAARQLKVGVEKVVLRYNGDELPDHVLIAQLRIQRNQQISVSVRK
jgi:hypothetical protein